MAICPENIARRSFAEGVCHVFLFPRAIKAGFMAEFPAYADNGGVYFLFCKCGKFNNSPGDVYVEKGKNLYTRINLGHGGTKWRREKYRKNTVPVTAYGGIFTENQRFYPEDSFYDIVDTSEYNKVIAAPTHPGVVYTGTEKKLVGLVDAVADYIVDDMKIPVFLT